MLVGNYFNHGLYHGLIPIHERPILNSAPAPLMYVSRVRDIMHKVLYICRAVSHWGIDNANETNRGQKCWYNAFQLSNQEIQDLLKGLLSKKDFFI